ncbi:MAG: hypothetical protein JWP94_2874 [Mucilaginibacter sp.]|nr:hypothetical protein [Mucilaginibacter sp.]
MTLYAFRALGQDEQANQVWEGVLLGQRTESDLNILLYGVHSFYVEVFYSNAENSIVRLRSFRTTKLLEPHLSQLDLP